ncbi:MAG: hydrogenase maturation protease [Bacteroidota bacterium]|nr:hydrogenase maturation protease [Bacteroidota bacterium]
MKEDSQILIYGYGNPGRTDDGLGNEFINRIEKWIKENELKGIEVDSNYQLNIEDADTISKNNYVIFVDASEEDIDDYILTKVEPSNASVEFTMHAVSSAFVLSLCNKIYNKYPETYILHIKGYEWEFKEELTNRAEENLNKALDFLKERLLKPEILKDSTVVLNVQ